MATRTTPAEKMMAVLSAIDGVTNIQRHKAHKVDEYPALTFTFRGFDFIMTYWGSNFSLAFQYDQDATILNSSVHSELSRLISEQLGIASVFVCTVWNIRNQCLWPCPYGCGLFVLVKFKVEPLCTLCVKIILTTLKCLTKGSVPIYLPCRVSVGYIRYIYIKSKHKESVGYVCTTQTASQ